MAIENVELMHECSPQHLYIGLARNKTKRQKKEDKWSRENMKRVKWVQSNEVPKAQGLALPYPKVTTL